MVRSTRRLVSDGSRYTRSGPLPRGGRGGARSLVVRVAAMDTAPSDNTAAARVGLSPVKTELAARRPEPVNSEVHENDVAHDLNVLAQRQAVRCIHNLRVG